MVSDSIPVSCGLFPMSRVFTVWLSYARVSVQLRLAPRLHPKGYLGIGSLGATGKTEEGTTPVSATPGQPLGNYFGPQRGLGGILIRSDKIGGLVRG